MNVSEKIRLVRKHYNLTQENFASSVGTSRANLTNIELGKVAPTQMFLHVISLRYNVDKLWLENDIGDDDVAKLINQKDAFEFNFEAYEMLDDRYKVFVQNQISALLAIQNGVSD